MSTFHGIAGVVGVEPIAAALTVGVKHSERGFPVEKDRFHVMEPRQSGDGKRRVHPAFGWYAKAPVEKRLIVPAIIVHDSWEACLEQHLSAWRLPDVAAPPSGPACQGDGVNARRFYGAKSADDWRAITCPHELCQYRKPRKGAVPCKPLTRLVARFDWPTETRDAVRAAGVMQDVGVVFRFTSGAWSTYRAILGLRQSLDAAAVALGAVDGNGRPAYSPLGLRFTLMLTEGRGEVDGKATRYPTVYAALSGSAPDFILQSRMAAATMRRQIAASSVEALGPMDRDEYAQIAGPTITGGS